MTMVPHSGRGPVPFQQFLLKVASRCNLTCSYCYVYQGADRSWARRPRFMSDAVVDAAVKRIEEHARAHGLEGVRVILHGGEPLLAGPQRLERILARVSELGDRPTSTGSRLAVEVFVHTNGLLLDDVMLDVLERYRVKVGISLDGTAEAHDRNRPHPDGAGTHAEVLSAIARLRSRPGMFSGLLGVIDLQADPVAWYEAMVACEPPRIDLLLPHATWSAPPPGLTVDPALPRRPTPYGDWLIAAFDRWYDTDHRETYVRFFDATLRLLLGLGTSSESLGTAPIDIVTIETDGWLEQVDSLKVAYDGAPGTGLHVLRDTLDDALSHPGIVARQLGLDALSCACRSCPLVSVCGGGLYTHRYREGTGFGNPSVYCQDLYRFITHVRDRLQADVDALRSSPPTRAVEEFGDGTEADVRSVAAPRRS